MIPGVDKRQFTFSSLHGYLVILLKHARLIVLLVLLCLSGGALYWLYAKPVYYVKAMIEVRLLAKASDNNVEYVDEGIYYTLQQQFQSDYILERTAGILGLRARQDRIKKQYVRAVMAKTNDERNLDVEAYPYSLDLAERWPAAMYTAFTQYRQERRMEQRQRKINSWTLDVQQVQSKIEVLERRREELKENMKQWELQMGLKELSSVPDQLVETRNTLRLFRQVDEKLREPGLDRNSRLALLERVQREATVSIGEIVPNVIRQGKTEVYPQAGSSVVVVPELVNPKDADWSRLDGRLQELKATLEMRRKIYLKDHPEIVSVEKEMAELETRLDNAITAVQNRFVVEFNSLKGREKELEGKLARLKDLDAKAKEFTEELERIENARQPWERMLANLQAGLDRVDADKELYVLKEPEILALPREPVSPNVTKLFIGVLALAVFLGLGVPFLLEYLDHTLTVVDDAERQLGLQSLGIVPRLDDDERPDESGQANRSKIVLETFRLVRTNLLTNKQGPDRRQVIMVTSSLPKEGKTMVAYNLAQSFANLGERTLLVDLDLRRGHLNRFFNQPREPGVTELLGNVNQNFTAFLRATPHDRLTFLAGGQRVENVAELLATNSIATVMNRLREQYDRIILDTPPVLGLAETSSILPLVDGVVLVIWSGYTPADDVKTAISALRNNGGTFLGFVLNRLDLKCPTNYFRYYYYSDYYYTSYHT